MAIRLLTAADVDTLVAIWSEYRTAETAAYARDQGWTREHVERMLTHPYRRVAIDPATETVGVFIIHPPATGEVVFIGTRTAAPLAARRAADAMLAWGLRRAVAAGLNRAFGQYIFPPGVDVSQLRAIRYFGGVPGVTRNPDEIDGDGDVRVTFETSDIPAVIAAVEAR